MKNLFSSLVSILLLLTTHTQLSTAHAQGTAFTYQGRLNNNGTNTTGIYDLRFTLFATNTTGTAIAGPVTNAAVGVTNGLFITPVNFGNAFTGTSNWIELGVRTNGAASFTTLAPRQQLTPVPYAIYATTASNLSGTVSAAQLPASVVTNNATGLNLSGSFTGNGAGLTNLNATQLASGTVPIARLTGITSNQLDAFTWGAATNLNGGFAALATNLVSGIRVTNLFITNSVFAGNGGGLTNLGAAQIVGTIPLGQLPASVVTNNATGLNLSGTFSGNGANVTNVNAATLGGLSSAGFWKTNGNAGANPTNGAFIGTTDNLPLVFKVNTNQALRLEYATNLSYGISPNVIGGYGGNVVSNGFVGGFIGGGGNTNNPNRVGANYASVLGGIGNEAGGNFSFAMGGFTTASGDYSSAMGYRTTASGFFSTAMGFGTTASGLGSTAMGRDTTARGSYSAAMGTNTYAFGYASIAMGRNTTASGTNSTAMGYGTTASGEYSTAMGDNSTANGDESTAMGRNTTASGYNSTAMGVSTMASGYYSTAMGFDTTASGDASTAMGDSTTASGISSTAMGNFTIASGSYSLAAGRDSAATNAYTTALGRRAKAINRGSFVWADSTDADVPSTQDDQFLVRASGGIRFYSDTNLTAGVRLPSGGTSWAVISDRNVKKDFSAINAVDILEKLSSLPITQWRYNWENAGTTPHIGPMAQDFKAAFYPGSDDKSITTLEADGVAFAAIQGLNQKNQNSEARIQKLETENAELKARLERLERLLSAAR